IYVVGKQWMWKIQHPTGQREINELHIPAGRKIKLVMTTEDVIHDFFVPAFRTKADVVPGRYTTLWFEATKPGRYHLFCAEYCGTNHSGMGGWVIVMNQTDFDQWLAGGENQESAVSAGQKLFQSQGCISCHGANGEGGKGPPLVGVFGSKVKLEGGAIVEADEEYIRNSIRNPQSQIVEGYTQPLMPTFFKEQLDEEHLLQLLAYIKSWLLTKDHKRIALLYLGSISLFFLIGGIYAMLIRLELLTPQGDLFQSHTYNKLFTQHGIIMVFFFLIPSIPAVLGNFLIPLMIGAKDLAFPKLNLLSWYIYTLGGLFTLWALINGGVDILFQHLFWFYSHPAVYIMVLPGMGVVSELIANFSRKNIFGYSFVAFSSIAIAVFGFLVWGHHMFVSGQSVYAGMIFSFLSFAVAIPSAVKVFNWTATLYKGSISYETPMLYGLGFIGLFTIGG